MTADDARLEAAEAAAFESMTRVAGWPLLRVGSAVCITTPLVPTSTMLNRAIGVGLDGNVDDGLIDEIDAFYRSRGIAYAVAVSPFAPRELDDLLRRRGFRDGYAWAKFGRTTAGGEDQRAPRTIEVHEGSEFGHVVSAAYQMPDALGATLSLLPGADGWHCFVAYDGETAIGAGALFAHDGVGWLGAAGTVAEHRGKGAQTAILAARIARARELGLERLTTETGELVPDRPSNSYRNILRAGFELLYIRPNLHAPQQ